MQHCLGSHVLPFDDRMHAVLIWLGLAERDEGPDQAGEHLRSFVRKAEAPLFCHLLGCLGNDPKRSRAFAGGSGKPVESPADGEALHRLEQLLRRGDAGGSKPKSSRPAPQRTEKDTNHSARSDKARADKDRAGRSKVSAKKRR
jgi:hypothetical protein